MDNNNRKILLERIHLPDTEKLSSLRKIVYSYLDTFHDGQYREEISDMKTEIENAYDEQYKVYTERHKTVKELLYGFWKVSKMDDRGNTLPVMYVYPYNLITTNDCLFCLYSPIKPDYNSDNGLHEKSFDIMEDNLFKDNTLLFEETTTEEMMENAKQSCEDALNERMWKLKYRDNVLN